MPKTAQVIMPLDAPRRKTLELPSNIRGTLSMYVTSQNVVRYRADFKNNNVRYHKVFATKDEAIAWMREAQSTITWSSPSGRRRKYISEAQATIAETKPAMRRIVVKRADVAQVPATDTSVSDVPAAAKTTPQFQTMDVLSTITSSFVAISNALQAINLDDRDRKVVSSYISNATALILVGLK